MNEDSSFCRCSQSDDGCSGHGDFAENGSNVVPKVPVCNNRTMCILEELNQIYEERLEDIDQQTNGSFELKYITYKEWVEMLIKLMKDLIDVVQELEFEASKRIELLEKKLLAENGPCNNNDIRNLRNDVHNLMELIRRAVEDGTWNVDGLEFATVKTKDIFRGKMEISVCSSAYTFTSDTPQQTATEMKKLNSQILVKNHEIKRLESEKNTLKTDLQNKELLISNYISQINTMEKTIKSPKERRKSYRCEEEETLTGNEEDAVFKNCIAELKQCLRDKEQQLAENLKQNESLQTELRLYKNQSIQKDKAVVNVRALAFEVAEKHDQILQLRCQMNSLEEELKKAQKKIQFKDNVIRELRRECKSSAKNPSPTRLANPIVCQCECANSGTDTDRLSFKSVGFVDSEGSQRSDNTMSTVIDTEIVNLSSTEDRYIQVLKDELNDLFQFQSCHSDAVEDEKRTLVSQQSKLRNAVNRMLGELTKNRSKLDYVRNQLLSINGDSNTSQSITKKIDSGYISPEDMEPESNIIDSVRNYLIELKEENVSLKLQVQKFNGDVMSAALSLGEKSSVYEYNERNLQEVASALSNICGKEISLDSGPLESCEGQIHPICQAMMNLEAELNEKGEIIENSREVLANRESELKSIKERCFHLEEECDNKNHTISQLQKAVEFHEHSIDRLQCVKEHLETELDGVKKMTENSEYEALLAAKNKLEIEYQNQATTINNLRKALEDSKKHGRLHTICTDEAYDVLSEQLTEMFDECMRLERMLLQIRDENLYLKEILVDTECDFQSLERKYLKISMKLNDTNDNNIKNEFKRLTDQSLRLHSEIEIPGGEKLYVNCFRHIRAKMEKECRKRLEDQEQKYREIIDDLTNDLTSLSDQVQMTQVQLNHDEIAVSFDASLRELESQNDLLRETIERLQSKLTCYELCMKNNNSEIRKLQNQNSTSLNLIEQKDAKYEELSGQYESLAKCMRAVKGYCKCDASQIVSSTFAQTGRVVFNLADQMSRELMSFKEERSRLSFSTCDRDDQIKQLETKISILEKTLEKRDKDLRETNDRLIDFATRDEEHRLKNTIDRLSHDLTELKIIGRDRESKLISELNLLRQTMDEHVKALSKANDTINCLERQMHMYRRQDDTASKENASLKAEVFKLRENLASQDGIEKSLRNQLTTTQSEMSAIRCDLERFNV